MISLHKDCLSQIHLSDIGKDRPCSVLLHNQSAQAYIAMQIARSFVLLILNIGEFYIFGWK